MQDKRRKKRKKSKTVKGSRNVWLIVTPVLVLLAILLLVLYLFVFSIRAVEVESVLGGHGEFTLVRYDEDVQQQLKVEVETDHGLASKAVVFQSSDPEIAAVSEEGLVTAKNPGEAVITVQAKYNPWVKTEVAVTVIQKALRMQVAMPEALPSNEYYYLLHTGDRPAFAARPEPANALVENLTYTSSNPEIVTVDENGVMEVHNTGIAEIQVAWTGPYTEKGKTENLGQFVVNVCRETDHHTLDEHEVQWYEESCLIVHALGNAGEHTYTNTLEALEESIAEGYKTLEVDLSLTSDGEVVCRHTWYSDTFGVSYDGSIPDLAAFKAEKYFGYLTPLSGRDLLEIWAEHPELYFVLDVKQDEGTTFLEVYEKLVALAREMGLSQLLDHVIVQLYAVEDYDRINEVYPAKHWLFTTYQLPDTPGAEIEAAAFAAEHGFDVLTVPAWCMGSDYFIELANEYHLPLFIHTVDEKELVQKCTKRGVYGYYTDYLLPNDLKGNGEY